jgi:Uma2 family endonuclease
MATRPQRSLTYEDYARFPEDGRRWELIDGEAFMVPSPTTDHQRIMLRFRDQIASFLKVHGGGECFVAPLDVVFAPEQVFQPDVIFVSDDDASVVTDQNIQGAPTWLIEIVSDPVRDKRVKRDAYARFGVREYWIVDPELRNVEIHRLGQEPFIIEPPAEPAPAVLSGLSVDLEDVFGPDRRPRRT